METNASQTEMQTEDIQFDSMDIMNTPVELYRGQIVTGTVIQIDTESIWVDVNYKSEGKIPVTEFEKLPEEGDKIEVKVVSLSDKNNDLLVSKRGAEASKMRFSLKDAFENETLLSGRIVKEAKNGLTVDFSGITGYVPMSHMEIGKALPAENYIGRDFDFQIIKFEERRNISVVASRKNILENLRAERIKEIFGSTTVGDTVKGVVKNITKVGVFIDLGGMDGLIRLDDLTWKRGVKPSTIVQTGQEVEAKVVNMDKEKGRIALSLKHLEEDPFVKFVENHNEDDVVTGKVVKLETFGAFVQVAEGVEGLLHISELSWTKRINHPKDVLKAGSEIQVKILGIDSDNRKLSFGFRQLIQNPYESIESDYPLASRHTGKISRVTDFGVFVELPTGIDGLVRKEDITWDKKEKNALDQFTAGEMVEVQVLRVDKKSGKISLGVKQLVDNPFETFKFNNPAGSRTTGKIVRIVDFGAFVELAPGIEGMVHISQLADKRVEKVSDVVAVGDTVNVKILEIDSEKGKISLSIKDYEKDMNDELISQHKGEDEGTFRLGDMIDLSKLPLSK